MARPACLAIAPIIHMRADGLIRPCACTGSLASTQSVLAPSCLPLSPHPDRSLCRLPRSIRRRRRHVQQSGSVS
eukprot:6176935-Pleurochrysis_carterae.AAC.2